MRRFNALKASVVILTWDISYIEIFQGTFQCLKGFSSDSDDGVGFAGNADIQGVSMP